MITNQQAEKLRQDIENGKHPVLNYPLWNAFNQRERIDKNSPAFKALVHAGILSPKGGITKAGRWYDVTCNGVRMYQQKRRHR